MPPSNEGGICIFSGICFFKRLLVLFRFALLAHVWHLDNRILPKAKAARRNLERKATRIVGSVKNEGELLHHTGLQLGGDELRALVTFGQKFGVALARGAELSLLIIHHLHPHRHHGMHFLVGVVGHGA